MDESDVDLAELDSSKNATPQDLLIDEDLDAIDSDRNDESGDLLEGQRQYNSAIHAIQEKVPKKFLSIASYMVDLFFLIYNPRPTCYTM